MKCRADWTLVLAAVSMAAYGCSDAGSAPPVAEVRDSAGVRLVENQGRIWTEGAAWRVGESLLHVGGLEAEADYQLYEVVGASVLSGGGVVVANNGSKELRFYDSSGRFEKAAGREGGGPGEFGRIWQMHRLGGDSLLIWDSGNVRLALHDGDGSFVRTFKLENGESGVARFPGMELVAFDDGSFLGLEWMGSRIMGAPQGVFRDTADFFLFDPEGRDLGPVASFPWMEIFVGKEQVTMMNGRTMNQRAPLRFGKATTLAAADSTFWATTGEPSLSHFDRQGRLLQRVWRADLPRIPVTQDLLAHDMDLYMAEEETHDHPQADLDRMRRTREDMPVADTVPPYRDLMVDEEGNLWAERHPGVDDPDRSSAWDVFEASGRFLGTVELPPRFEPFEIGADYVLGVQLDELDLEHLLMLRLEKPGDEATRRRS